ncbi:MAG TPA: hypothetical protein VMA36_08395 [Candidatus Limnocylindria bacterium]|jgi:hypothetical protein|nr:hypothetical protein [Candidatus Limnocylindria bacterium]
MKPSRVLMCVGSQLQLHLREIEAVFRRFTRPEDKLRPTFVI